MIGESLLAVSLPWKSITFDYVNYRGEKSHRKVRPRSIRYGTSEYHPEPQWLLTAWDEDKGADREFAMKDTTNVDFVP